MRHVRRRCQEPGQNPHVSVCYALREIGKRGEKNVGERTKNERFAEGDPQCTHSANRFATKLLAQSESLMLV